MSRALKGVWIFILCLILTACSQSGQTSEAPQAVEGYLDLQNWDFNNRGIVSLSGDWAFYWQELLTPSEIKTDSNTKYVPVPAIWTNYEMNSQVLPVAGFSTYRLIVQLPNPSQDYGLFIEGEGTAYNLWVEGQLVAQNGHVATNSQEMTPQSVPEVVFFHPSGDTAELVIQISNFHHRKAGFRNAILLGLPSQILNYQRKGWAEDGFVLGIYLVMGLYHLFIFAFRPNNKSPLYFALWSILSFVRAGLLDHKLLVFFLPNMSWELALRLEYLTFYFSTPVYALFMYSLYPRDIHRRVLQAIVALGIFFSTFMFFIDTLTLSYAPTIYQGIIVLEILYFIFFLGRILVRKREGSIYIAVASAIGFTGVILEVLYVQNLISFEINSVYTFQAFIVIQAIMLSSLFSKSFKRVKVLSDELEETNVSLRESESRYRSIFEESKDMIFIASLDGRIKAANASSRELLGYSQDELKQMKLSDILLHSKDKLKLENTLRREVTVRDYELELQRKDGHSFHALVTLTLRKDERGVAREMQGHIHDISAVKQAESASIRAREYEQLALTDPLTNIYNRRFFDEIASKEIERAKRSNSLLTIIIFDIDHFKNVNDAFGHLTGDQVLTNLAFICQTNMRSMDVFARFGGEEFIILMPDTDSNSAYQTMERLRAFVESTCMATYDDQDIYVTISAGIITWNGQGDLDFHTLLNRADQALYTSKQAGRNKATIWKKT